VVETNMVQKRCETFFQIIYFSSDIKYTAKLHKTCKIMHRLIGKCLLDMRL